MDSRYAFITEWYDNASSIIKTFSLLYYPQEECIELIERKNKRIFLKKTKYISIKLSNLFLGSIWNIYSRQMKIIEYGDLFTKNKFESQKERTFAMIKPCSTHNCGKIISMIESSGFIISNLKMSLFSREQSEEFYSEHKGKSFFENLINFMTSGYVIGMELIKENAIKKWRELLGPTNSLDAKNKAPNSIRGLFGTDGTKNSCHGSDSLTSSQRELKIFFSENSSLITPASLNNCSLLLIKPHIIKEKQLGKILDKIISLGIKFDAMNLFNLDKSLAKEIFGVYKEVLPEYLNILEEITSGYCLALEVVGDNENIVQNLRELAGPHDPQIAKILRPNTLRAEFGFNRVNNAVHCTDLVEDGILECQYFFKLLQ